MSNEIVQYRTVYRVAGPGDEVRTYNERSEAETAVRCLFAAPVIDLNDTAGDFNGGITWHTEQVPASLFDELVIEYGENIHGGGMGNSLTDLDLDRDAPYLLVEENRRGGYWLSTWNSRRDARRYNRDQEYAEDWEIVTLVALTTGARWAA